jgi:similar to spore coat protein
MAQQNLALHESLEVHEVLVFKSVCMTKSQTMQGLAQDAALKALLQKDVQESTQQISELQGLLSRGITH